MANWANVGRLGDPRTPGWQEQNLTWIEPVPGQRWQVYREAAPAFEGLLRDLVARGYNPTSSGGFNYRNIRGSNRLSQHAFGTAIDINAAANALGSTRTDIPDAAALAAKYGLEWGGNWKGRPDPMHFEFQGVKGGQAEPQASQAGQAPGFPEQQQPLPMPAPVNNVASIYRNAIFGGDQDWMQNRSYSFDALASDFFAGRNPLRRFIYQKLFA
jgi:hypothetical protein